jgi:carboxylesterase
MIQQAEFILKGGKAGVLLIHGLTGTPNEMRLVGKGLHKAGFTVYGMQLAGHCGDEKDLLATSWQDWYRSVEVAAEKLRESVDYLFVAGLSMGAVLALKLAAEQPKHVDGVGVYGPTFRYDGWSIPAYARYLGFLVTWFKPFKLFQNHVFAEQPPYGLKDERLREVIARSMLSGDSASAGLAGNPWPSLAEMIHLSANVKRELHNVIAPCLIMHASNDDIAHINNSKLVARNVKGSVNFVELHDSYHMITIDRERKTVIDESVKFFQGVIDQKNSDKKNKVPNTFNENAD